MFISLVATSTCHDRGVVLMIINPILPGFNPDPSILRMGDDYYIATSTFEWWPGVQIHHSRDLKHWRLLAHALTRKSQLDMIGNPPSCGVWAPCLSYDDGRFFLIFTDVKGGDFGESSYRNHHNYLVTAANVEGPWSEPIYLNSSGFDPSLFHDDDGRKWLVNMVWDHRTGRNPFGGILLQEYNLKAQKLVGPVKNIFRGTELGFTEGPHLYKHDGYYYLLTAEGGTGYDHAVTMARSDSIFGPYEVDPQNPVLTSKDHPELVLQKAGHASVVETQENEWYIAHLCSRPSHSGYSPLGRETALQRMVWTDDGWLRLAMGEHLPEVQVSAPKLPASPCNEEIMHYDFNEPVLPLYLNTLREPADESWLSLTARPGWLRLRGREGLNSNFRQSLVGHRVQHFDVQVDTCMEFAPGSFLQQAGMASFYHGQAYYYLRVTKDESRGVVLGIDKRIKDDAIFPVEQELEVNDWDVFYLRLVISQGVDLQFLASPDGKHYQTLGPVLDASLLSDEIAGGFTGLFAVLCCQDFECGEAIAYFDYLNYQIINTP